MKIRTIINCIKKFEPFGQEPYPDNSPILLMWDADMGWIIEAANEGEYEVENLPYLDESMNDEPDFDAAINLAIERNTRVIYYPKPFNS